MTIKAAKNENVYDSFNMFFHIMNFVLKAITFDVPVYLGKKKNDLKGDLNKSRHAFDKGCHKKKISNRHILETICF